MCRSTTPTMKQRLSMSTSVGPILRPGDSSPEPAIQIGRRLFSAGRGLFDFLLTFFFFFFFAAVCRTAVQPIDGKRCKENKKKTRKKKREKNSSTTKSFLTGEAHLVEERALLACRCAARLRSSAQYARNREQRANLATHRLAGRSHLLAARRACCAQASRRRRRMR